MRLDPLDPTFWDSRGDLLPHAAEMGPLTRDDVDRLFRRERVRIIVHDRGGRSREVDFTQSLQFWQGHARIHTVEPDRVYISSSSMPGEIAYRASEWYDGRGAAVVLLEILR